MRKYPEKILAQFEIPAILSICAFLFGVVFTRIDHTLWQVATLIPLLAAASALVFALYVAAKLDRWV